MEGVLPFDNERTADGAMAARRKGLFCFFPLFHRLNQWHTLLLWLSLRRLSNIKIVKQAHTHTLAAAMGRWGAEWGRGGQLITWPRGVSELSELPGLVEKQSELLDTTVLQGKQRG